MNHAGSARALVLGFSIMLAPGPAVAQGDPDEPLSPYFLIDAGDRSAAAFPLRSTDIAVSINGVIADVVVRQEYANQGSVPINARYVFPGSTRASVHGMRMTIGDQLVVARIEEKKQARREFDAAKARGQSASLLEQERPNVFTMSVANILPGDRVEVELHYTELLVPDEGTYTFVYPTVVAPRYSRGVEVSPVSRLLETAMYSLSEPDLGTFDIRVTLSTGLPLQDVDCPTHPHFLDWGGESVARVTLEDMGEFAGDRDFILSYRLQGGEIESGLLLYEGEDENFFLLMVQPPDRIRPEEIPPREYIFILDVSGSMEGFPLATARSVIVDLISGLERTDLFNVILFAGGSRVMSPRSVEATEENVSAALEVIDREQGGGGTEIAAAFHAALALPRREDYSRTIVVMTDGLVEAESELFELIADNLDRTNVFCFGIGSSVNRYLVEGIAKAGLGEPFVVTRPDDAGPAATRFRKYIASPVLTGLRVEYAGFDAYEIEPPRLPDLFAERPVVVFGKYRGAASGEIRVSGSSGAGEYASSFTVSEVQPLEENAALRYLWARSTIARLTDFNFGQEPPDLVDRVTSLGLTYSLLTKYTSFVAVIETVRNVDAGSTEEIAQPLPNPWGMRACAVGAYRAGSEPELWLLMLLAGLVAPWVLLRGGTAR